PAIDEDVLEDDDGRTRHLQTIERERHGEQLAFSRIDNVAAPNIAGTCSAFDQNAPLARTEGQKFDSRFVPVVGIGRRYGQKYRITVRQHVRPSNRFLATLPLRCNDELLRITSAG